MRRIQATTCILGLALVASSSVASAQSAPPPATPKPAPTPPPATVPAPGAPVPAPQGSAPSTAPGPGTAAPSTSSAPGETPEDSSTRPDAPSLTPPVAPVAAPVKEDGEGDAEKPVAPPAQDPGLGETGEAGAEDGQRTEQAPSAPPAASVLSKPSPHQGHFIALGLHAVGAFANDRDRGRRGPNLGEGYSLRVGERITDWLDLGLSIGVANIGGKNPWTLGHFGIHAQYYPVEHWFVHGGFGFGAGGGDDPEDPAFSRGRFGDSYHAGVGHNIYLGDKERSGGWILTPVMTGEYGRDNQFPTTSLSFGLEISYWTGIPRNQLELDFDKAYKPRK